MAVNRKIVVRLVLFLLAAGVAVGSFTTAVMSLAHRDSGWYEVEPGAAAKATVYDSGVHLMYYASGGSNEIRQRLNAVEQNFSEILMRYDKMLDARETYDDAVNIASVIAADGEPVTISRELYDVLADAQAKTEENRGYNLFGGALWREWELLRYLDEPAEFDPANNADEAARLAALADMTNRRDLFSLTLGTDGTGCTAVFSTAQAYRDFEAEHEIDAPALDLNALREAYLASLTARAMISRGLTAGYLYTDGGLTVVLGGEPFVFVLNGWKDGAAARVGDVAVSGPAAMCQYTAFPAQGEKYGWYAVDTAEGRRLRHAHYDARTGGFRDVLMSVAVASKTRDVADLAYEGIVLNALESAAEVEKYLAEDAGTLAVYTLQGEPNSPAHVLGEEGWEIKWR